jgi:hypothetical protein
MAGLKVHIQLIQATGMSIGEIPLKKVIDFRVLEEIRREESR